LLNNQNIQLRTCILKGGTTPGHIIYFETHTTITNEYGLASVQVGNGVTTDTLANINWGNDSYYLMLEVDTSGTGSSFQVLATTQLLAVPYALYSENVGNDAVDDADADPINEIQTLSLSGGDLTITNGNTVTLPSSGGSGFSNMQVFDTPGSYSFTIPAGVDKVMVEIRGGGGGGGKGNAGGGAVGQGGSGSGYGKGIYTVSAGSNYTVIVGSGGAGSAGGTCSPGSTGGTSSFGNLIQATGGVGGGGCGNTSSGGSSTGMLNMDGFLGHQYYTTTENRGGASGDGSMIGRGGNGNEFFGRDGNDGNVVVYW
jgi:hypothetical protein